MLGGDARRTPELRQRAKEQLGLTGSYPEQYWHWISRMFHGDLGRSLYHLAADHGDIAHGASDHDRAGASSGS